MVCPIKDFDMYKEFWGLLTFCTKTCLMINKGWGIILKRGYKQMCNNWAGEHTCESPVYIGKGFGMRVNERESAWSWEI